MATRSSLTEAPGQSACWSRRAPRRWVRPLPRGTVLDGWPFSCATPLAPDGDLAAVCGRGGLVRGAPVAHGTRGDYDATSSRGLEAAAGRSPFCLGGGIRCAGLVVRLSPENVSLRIFRPVSTAIGRQGDQ